MNQYVHQNPRIWGSYEAEVENVRNYIKQRIPWMDLKIGFDASQLNTYDEPSMPETEEVKKVVQNGQLFILRDGKRYTLTGIQVD